MNNSTIHCCDDKQVVSIFMVIFFIAVISLFVVCICKKKNTLHMYEQI